MKSKSIWMSLLLVGCLLAVYTLAAAPAKQTTRQTASQSINWKYAQLVVMSDDEFTWLVGGDQPERVRPLRGLLGDLGGTGRPTLANLLDQIGSKGWELVTVGDSVWTFKRRN